MTSEVGATYLKMFGAVLRIRGSLQDSLAQSFQKLWLIIASCVKILAPWGLAYLKSVSRFFIFHHNVKDEVSLFVSAKV